MDRIRAAYLRTSVGDSDETRQRDEINKWADRTKNTIDEWFFDSGGKRHKADKRKDWQAMMTLVRQGKIEFIVVEEHTRWGYADIYQFFIHMDELRQHKVVLYEARTGRILNPHPNEMGGLITSSVQSVQSHQETANLAARSLKAKLLRAEQGQWGGGPIPYALAVACRNKTNETLWTVEQVGDSFEQHYPNGISRILTYFPTDREEKVEFLYLIPSRYQDRIEAVRCIFRWVQDEPDVSLSEITRRLIKQGHRPATGGVFRYTLVHSILNQPVYTGYYFYAKQSKARHHTQVNGTEMRALEEPENVLKPPEQWIRGPQIFAPLITQGAYDGARKYLAGYIPRKARDERFWLSGLLYCPNGHKLHGWAPLKSKQPILKYICNTHRKLGKSACPHTYMIKHDQVARLVIDYLDEIGADLRGLSLNSLYQRKGKLHRRWRELRDLVDRLLYDKLGTLFHYQQQGKVRVFDVPLDGWGLVRIPGEARVEELLDLVVAAEHANCGQELGMLRKRHAKIVASFPEATPGIRKALAQEAVKLEAEIERLSVGLGSLGGELRAVFKDISALAYEVSRAQRMLVDSDHQAMAEAVRSVLERIDCEFEVISYPSGYEFTRLKGVRITPRLGNPEYRGVPQNGIPLRRCR